MKDPDLLQGNPPSLIPGLDDLYHPRSEDQLVQLVKKAASNKLKVRVRGSQHSVRQSIYTPDYFTYSPAGPDSRGINIYLDQYRDILEWDEKNYRVKVQSGINLSIDPSDPTGTSTVENGLLYQLNQKGWALPDLGGITHQTIGGFTSNGCAGGSLMYSFMDAIYEITYVDGQGNVSTVTRDENDLNSEFWAVGVSMGLLGIISTITLQCVPRYFIKGQAAVTKLKDCAVDLFGDGNGQKKSLEQYLRDTPYTRLEWWPQPGVNVMQVWKAHRMQPDEFPTLNFDRLPYKEFGSKPMLAELMGEMLYDFSATST